MHSALLFALLLLSACSDRNAFSFYDTGAPEPRRDMGREPLDLDHDGIPLADRYSTRLSRLAFVGPPAADLNGIIELNMDLARTSPIIILHEFSEIDEVTGSAVLTSTNAVKTANADVFAYDPAYTPVSTPATLQVGNGQFSGTFSRFLFVATIEFDSSTQTISIPLTDLTISGVVSLGADATASIPSGTWTGHITKTDGDQTMVVLAGAADPRPLTDLFLVETLNFDTGTGAQVDAGTGDAWFIRGEFEAVAADVTR